MPFFKDSETSQLFSDRDLQTLMHDQSVRAKIEVENIDPEQLLATPTDDILKLIVSELAIKVPKLLEDLTFQDAPYEVFRQVDAHPKPVEVRGFLYRLKVPFEGHLGLFRHSVPLTGAAPPRVKAPYL